MISLDTVLGLGFISPNNDEIYVLDTEIGIINFYHANDILCTWSGNGSCIKIKDDTHLSQIVTAIT
jgi:hypothetical protein